MNNESIAKLIKEFKSLSISDRERFIDFITVNSAPSDFKTVIDTKLAEGIVCPHCSAKGKGVRKRRAEKRISEKWSSSFLLLPLQQKVLGND